MHSSDSQRRIRLVEDFVSVSALVYGDSNEFVRDAIWSVTDELNNGLRGVSLFDVLGDSKL